VGRRFLELLTTEFRGVRQRRWNAERPIVFAAVVLQNTKGVRRSKDIRRRLTRRMDLWAAGRHAALVDDTEAECSSRIGGTRPPADEASIARSFNGQVLSGRLRQAVRKLTDRGGGGVLLPDSVDSKSGQTVEAVLRSKHPDLRVPDLEDPDCSAFEPYPDLPDPIPVEITAEDVEQVASRLSGVAGPGGTDAIDLRNWLLRFGAESEALRNEMASWAEWLANAAPPYAAYRALMACRLVALDKQPGVRPVGIGEIYRRLLAKCLLKVEGHQATSACGNHNLCAGLAAGIEGAIHAVRERTAGPPAGAPPAQQATQDAEDPPGELSTQPPAPPDPPTDEEMDAQGTSPSVLLLVDARNGFNELSRLAMLWTVRHRWPSGARFAFNCYRHSATLLLRRPGEAALVLAGREGVTQGDPLSMVLYGLALTPLSEDLRAAAPEILQPWSADDRAMEGPAAGVARVMRLLNRRGPDRGYYPEPAKSIAICSPAQQAAAREILAEFDFRYEAGSRYVGGFIGTDGALDQWLQPQIAKWRDGVQALARVARRHPQTAYAGLAKSLQSEWQYVQRVAPGIGDRFAEVEEAQTKDFLPALLGESGPVPDSLRTLAGLGTDSAGIGLPDPSSTADRNHAASVESAAVLTASLLEGAHLDQALHRSQAAKGRILGKAARASAEAEELSRLKQSATPTASRRMERARETGRWLHTMPDSLNGTALSPEEFRDSLRLRLGLTPQDLPLHCDGCGAHFTVGHAMACKKGGLVLLRHNDLAAEWGEMCAAALTPSAVSTEPLIHKGRAADRANAPATHGTAVNPELRGDVGVHGFWRRAATTIFDVRITDVQAPSNQGMDPAKILARHEREKKGKYLEACLERRRHFTPLVYSVDGMMGCEAKAAGKKLASHLSAKWSRTYSEVCGYVLSWQSLALVRATTLCLRGACDSTARLTRPVWDSGTGLGLYR
jgi:hypothetical protein